MILQVKFLMSNNQDLEMHDCTGEEQLPLSFTMNIQDVIPLSNRVGSRKFSFMEEVGGVVHDGQQLVRHPLLHHLFQGGQPRADVRTCFPDQFIHTVGVLCLHACAQAHHSKENCACHNRLIKH